MSYLTRALIAACLTASFASAQRGGTSTWELISAKYDKNQDGKVTKEEHGRGDRAFANLDRNGDGTIDATDFERRRRNARRRPGGARRSGERSRTEQLAHTLSDTFGSFLNRDGKPGIDKTEWKGIIAKLKPAKDGTIARENLSLLLGAEGKERMARMASNRLGRLLDEDRDGQVTRGDLERLFALLDANGDGNIEQGTEIDLPPGLGEVAPDFTLPFVKDEKRTATLSEFRKKKPVGLIFGSYT